MLGAPCSDSEGVDAPDGSERPDHLSAAVTKYYFKGI